MNKKMTLSIKSPCSENFSKFAQTDKGGYCMSCEKTVVDFRKMNDAGILNYFNNQQKNVCGYFLEAQLKTYSSHSPFVNGHKPNKFISSLFGFSLFSLLSLSNIYAQEKNKENETVKIAKDTNEEQNDSIETNT